MLPVADLAELLVSIIYLILGFTLQDTYLAHTSILLVCNVIPSLAKLLACLPMLTVGDPNRKSKLISVWPFKLYFWTRVIALGLLLWIIIVNVSLSSYAIASSQLYNNFDYGLCSFCFVKTSCVKSYNLYIGSLTKTGAETSQFLSDKSNVTFT